VPPIEAGRVAAERGIRIHTVAIGDPTTVGEEKLDAETLRALARNSGGAYFFAADRNQLMGIYDELDRIETRQVKVVGHRPRLDLFFWPLLGALLLWLGEKAWAVLRRSYAPVSEQAPVPVRVDPLSGRLEVEPHEQGMASSVGRNPPKLQPSKTPAGKETRIFPRSGDRGFLRRRVQA